MVDIDNLLGTKEVAKLLGYKDNAFSMLKARSKDFPNPIKILSATPLYRISDIKEWAHKHGKEIKNINKIKNSTLKVCLVGDEHSGKSFLCSLFLKDSVNYRISLAYISRYCNIKSVIKQYLDSTEEIVYIKVLPSILHYFKNDNYVLERLKSIDGMKSKLCNSSMLCERLEIVFSDLESKGYDMSDICEITVISEASSMTRKIMEKFNISDVIIYDTCSCNNNNKYTQILLSKCDLSLVIFNNYDKDYIDKLLEKLTPSIYYNNHLLLYRASESVDDENEWEDIQNLYTKKISLLENEFNKIINNSIIASSINKDIIGIPVMKAKKITKSEELLIEKLGDTILNLLSTDNNVFSTKEQIIDKKFNTIYFIEELLSKLNLKDIDNYFKPYYVEDNNLSLDDNYHILNYVDNVRYGLLFNITKTFNTLIAKDYPNKVQQGIIKYVYDVLTKTILNDAGISYMDILDNSDYNTCLHVIESILAKEILELSDLSYCEMLSNKGNIKSKLLGFIELREDIEQDIEKLRLVVECNLKELGSNSLYEMIKNCFIIGLEKFGEYKIFKTFLELNNENDSRTIAISKIKKLLEKQYKQETEV